jgi:hypothetical protein
MLFSSNTCRFALFFFLSLSANAETVRGAHRELAAVTAVELLTAGNYAILAKTGISTVPTSAITGNIGVSPIAATAITGFTLTLDSDAQFSEDQTQIVGQAHAASYGGAIATLLTTAVSNMEAAYTDAAGRLNSEAARINLGSGSLGGDFGGPGAPLTPGVYTFGSDVTIGSGIVFQGSGEAGADDVFIIQMTGNLKQDAHTKVTLEGGALAQNIFWQIAGKVEVEANAHLEGILLVKTAVTFVTGSSLNGRVLTQTACNLDQATITP